MPILVSNPRDHTIYLPSHDGDSVAIHPKSVKVRVAHKFGWQVPSFMKVIDLGPDEKCPTTIVPGREPVPARRPPRSHNKNRSETVETRTAAQVREAVANKKRLREAVAQREAAAKNMSSEVKN